MQTAHHPITCTPVGLGGFSLKRMKDKSLKAVSDRFKKNKASRKLDIS